MNFKQSLDKYLTSEPDEGGFSNFYETVANCFPNEFWDKHEEWLIDSSGQCNKWVNRLYDKYRNPFDAARIIERAFHFYKCDKPKESVVSMGGEV